MTNDNKPSAAPVLEVQCVPCGGECKVWQQRAAPVSVDAEFNELLEAYVYARIGQGRAKEGRGDARQAKEALRAYVNTLRHPNPEADKALADLQEDYRKAKVEAEQLAVWLWKKRYKDDAPKWGLCDSLAGVMTQIDNMVCRLVIPAPQVSASDGVEPVAWRYRRHSDDKPWPIDAEHAQWYFVIHSDSALHDQGIQTNSVQWVANDDKYDWQALYTQSAISGAGK
jgi:hypothetical protein